VRIPVIIERVAGNGYRASGGEPLGLIAEGSTREAALQELRSLLEARIAGGAEITSIELPEDHSAHPWLAFAGMFRDDPLVEEWKRVMASRRRGDCGTSELARIP
jgi:predicted RNase H-like HicB family nuclease